MLTQDIWTAIIALCVVAAACALMWLGWRRRTRSQESLLGALPEAPEYLGDTVLGPLTGVYIGTTRAGHWQDRITRHPLGFRSSGLLTLFSEGVLLDLDSDPVWIPRESIRSIRTESRLANKVVPKHGILVLEWEAPGLEGTDRVCLDTGFRADNKDSYPEWTAVKEKL